jgi:hypothetical protein
MPRFYQSQTIHIIWVAAFDPRINRFSVTDDFGNLYPIRLPQLQTSLLG